jgi:hypothetical protein
MGITNCLRSSRYALVSAMHIPIDAAIPWQAPRTCGLFRTDAAIGVIRASTLAANHRARSNAIAESVFGGGKLDLKCINVDGCTGSIPDSELRRVLPEDTLEKYLERLQEVSTC